MPPNLDYSTETAKQRRLRQLEVSFLQLHGKLEISLNLFLVAFSLWFWDSVFLFAQKCWGSYRMEAAAALRPSVGVCCGSVKSGFLSMHVAPDSFRFRSNSPFSASRIKVPWSLIHFPFSDRCVQREYMKRVKYAALNCLVFFLVDKFWYWSVLYSKIRNMYYDTRWFV